MSTDRLGPYTLLHEIGSGGMGVVYEAQQTAPIRRRVAIKVIPIGLDTEEIRARFEIEKQALALMDHPNIARVLDAGTTPEGRPYFVMELVRGVPLTHYADSNKLDLKSRLELIRMVCQAVQHAHQKGVIHRDLKPSNILVSMQDGLPAPKVIDFGIAKAIGADLASVVTRPDAVVGTPAYVSPEQVQGSIAGMDTRTDVYSLGVILYELLIGARPFEPRGLNPAEMVAAIQLRDPQTPSTRYTTLPPDRREAVATFRRTDPAHLRRSLRGDLDWIVMKAIEKDRSRRYGTAEALARDLDRFLKGEPVEARPPTTLYRVSKFVHRHRAPVVVSVLALIALAGTAIVATLGWLEAREARERAERSQRVMADARGQVVSSERMLREVFSSVIRPLRGSRVVDSLLSSALVDLTNKDQSWLAQKQAAFLYGEAGFDDQAKQLYERALSADTRAGIPLSERIELLSELGRTELRRGAHIRAVEVLQQALALHDSLTPGTPELPNDTAEILRDLANAQEQLGNRERAATLRRQADDIQRRRQQTEQALRRQLSIDSAPP